MLINFSEPIMPRLPLRAGKVGARMTEIAFFRPNQQVLSLLPQALRDLSWGVKTFGSVAMFGAVFRQYVIYDEKAIEIIASGSTPELAAKSAAASYSSK